MNFYYVLAAVLIVFLAIKFRRALRHQSYIEPALNHVRTLQEGSVEEGFMASMGSLGVVYLPAVVTELDYVAVVYVRAAYKRGGYPEHERFYLVQVERAKHSVNKVMQCDTIESAAIDFGSGRYG